MSLPVAALSGGQKTRLGLAKVLLGAPNLLLLDEPTNHLDLPMLAWLENWLSRFKGAVLLVSHDRVFLDRADQSRAVSRSADAHAARLRGQLHGLSGAEPGGARAAVGGVSSSKKPKSGG